MTRWKNEIYLVEMQEAMGCELCVQSKRKGNRSIESFLSEYSTLTSANCGRLSSKEPVVLIKPFSYDKERNRSKEKIHFQRTNIFAYGWWWWSFWWEWFRFVKIAEFFCVTNGIQIINFCVMIAWWMSWIMKVEFSIAFNSWCTFFITNWIDLCMMYIIGKTQGWIYEKFLLQWLCQCQIIYLHCLFFLWVMFERDFLYQIPELSVEV